MKNTSITQKLTLGAAVGLALSAFGATAGAQELNVYSYRQAFLIDPLVQAFEKETGAKVNIVFSKKGLLQRLQSEGMNSPADVVLTADASQIVQFDQAGLLQPFKSDALKGNVPAQYRDPNDMWTGLTMRARAVYASKTRVKEGELTTYEDLAKPHMKGRICTRSGKHPYNVTLTASIIAANGEAAAEDWARGVKANLARKPQGNDRAQVKAIFEGECDVSLGNSYYFGKMITNEKKPEQKEWAAAVNILFPNQGDRGTHVNVSTGAITKASKNFDLANAFLTFLSSETAQTIYSSGNFEYPLKPGVQMDPLVASWGTFKADDTNLTKIVAAQTAATKLMDKVGFDD